MSRTETSDDQGSGERREALALLARATPDELRAAWQSLTDPPDYEVLRKPETGLVMVRGRVGGGGSPFNLGEASVTRATVQLSTGEVGFAQGLGRDRTKALHAALFDALWQTARRDEVAARVLAPIRLRLSEEAARQARQTAATRVNFFTLVRGED